MFAKKKSLDAILSSFTKVVEDLKVLQEENLKEVAKNDEKIEELNEKSGVLLIESNKAKTVAEKLQNLLS